MGLLTIPFYMAVGPFLVAYMLGWWSLLPIGASIWLLILAGKRLVGAYWVGFFAFFIATIAAYAVVISPIDTNALSGPGMVDLGGILVGAVGWLLDLLLIGIVASLLGQRERAQAQGKS